MTSTVAAALSTSRTRSRVAIAEGDASRPVAATIAQPEERHLLGGAEDADSPAFSESVHVTPSWSWSSGS